MKEVSEKESNSKFIENIVKFDGPHSFPPKGKGSLPFEQSMEWTSR